MSHARQPAHPSSPPPALPRSAEVVSLPVGVSDEEELVLGLIEKRPRAVAELFDRYSSVVRSFLVRVLGSTVDLDDLTQETFLIVVRRCPTLQRASALRSFVVSVAIRVAKNELRKRAVRRFVGLGDMSEVPVVPPHDPAAVEGVRQLYRALDKLDADSRMAFVLRHVEGFELSETAESCNCSLATVKRRLARAEKRFRAISRADPVLRALLEGREKP